MRAWLICILGGLALLGAATSASSAQKGMCQRRVDRAHVVRATGGGSLVHRRAAHRVELVLLHVSRSALRLAIAGHGSCRVDLAGFEQRWKSGRYQLHARLRSAGGSWEIRVGFVHYDAARHLLRVRGRVEDHEVTGHPTNSFIPSQANDSTEIVYASTFVPFDSSF
ncbi:MAG: hypothetical protein M3076_08565 [Actinomycetota bacterium]|nr:hypothetical protein [Actinomycetota bacterium]